MKLLRKDRSDIRNAHADLEKALEEIGKALEEIGKKIEHKETTVKDVLTFMAPHQLARCLAASAIHQIGGTLELKSEKPGSTLLRDLTSEMRRCARDIIETVESDPSMFYVQISMAVSSCVLKLVDMERNNDE